MSAERAIPDPAGVPAEVSANSGPAPQPERPAEPPDAVLAAAARIVGVFSARSGGAGPDASTDFEFALPALLAAMGWAGEPRHLLDALPHFDLVDTPEKTRVVLHHLGFRTEARRARLDALGAADAPCVCVVDPASAARAGITPAAFVFVGPAAGGGLEIIAEGARRVLPAEAAQGRFAEVVRAHDRDLDPEGVAPDSAKVSWFWGAIRKLRTSFHAVLALTFAVNLFALTTPLFSMAVYNNVIRSGMTTTLIAAATLALGAVLLESHLRRMRGEVLATVAARLTNQVQQAAFGRILTLPAAMTETASVGMQTARLKQFEGVLGVFTGPLAVAALDLPFTLLFLVVIALIGGPLVWIPVALMAVFAAASLLLAPSSRRRNAEAAQTRLMTNDLVRQTIRGAETLRGLGAETAWLDKMGPALRANARSKLRIQMQDAAVRSAAQLLTALAGVLVLASGAYLVIEERLSMGGLIAVMMIVWRVLSPIQTAFLSLNQIASTRDAIRQIDNLMKLQGERSLERPPTIYRRFGGALRVASLSFRYPRATDVVLRGVSFSAAPGERVGLLGPSGGGKTTIAKILLKLHAPSAGQVFLDDLTLAQLDPGEVRAAIAYAAERPELFFGTLAQNIRLASRTATDAEIEGALEEVGLALGTGALADGLAARLTAERLAALTDAQVQQISLARAFVKETPYLCLDDPFTHLGQDARRSVLGALKRRSGRQTTLLVTNDAEALSHCDRVLVLSEGRIALDDAPDVVLPQARHLLTGA